MLRSSRLALFLLVFLALCLLAPYAGLHIFTTPPGDPWQSGFGDARDANYHRQSVLRQGSGVTRDPAPEIPEIDDLLSK
jgi:hypothetical protein